MLLLDEVKLGLLLRDPEQTRRQAVARTADRTVKNCRGHVT